MHEAETVAEQLLVEKINSCCVYCKVTVWETGVAACQLALPLWDAVMVAVPRDLITALFPEMANTFGLLLV